MSKTKSTALILGVFIMSFLVGYLVLAWTEPTTAPPGGNVPAPLNTSINAQSKEGALVIGTNSAVTTGLIVQNGNVGIGTTSPSSGTGGQLKLDVEGNVGAEWYCDKDGDNCKEATYMWGSFGVWEDKNAGTVYQAATDGFVVAIAQSGNVVIEGLTDSNNPPTTRRVWENAVNQAPESVTMPVKKGNFWKINFSAATTYQRVSWIPLGQ